jgi:DNA-binding MarR family transcriptional regulator
MNADDREDQITLSLLGEIENDNAVSQRRLSKSLGVALGLTNSYLKRCVRQGYIRIKQVPPKRYLYYLTPKGFSEKSRLSTRYLVNSFSFYREASGSCLACFNECKNNGWKRVVLCGISELAEIATLRADECGITIVGFYDRDYKKKKYLRWKVWNDLSKMDDHDAILLTDLTEPSGILNHLETEGIENIVVPDLISRITNPGIRE